MRQQHAEILQCRLIIRSLLQLLPVSGDRLVGFAGQLQFHRQIAIGAPVVRTNFKLLAKRGDCLGVIVGRGVGKSQIVPAILHAGSRQRWVSIHCAFQQVDGPAIVLALRCPHPRFKQFLGSSFHPGDLGSLPRRSQNRARQQLIFIAMRSVAKRFVVGAPGRRHLVHLHDEFALAFQKSLIQRV